MGTLSRVIITAVALTVAVGVSPAAAAAPFTVGQGVEPRVAVGPDGRGHVVWNIPQRAGAPAKVGYCRIPAGASKCDVSVELNYPAGVPGLAQGGDATVFAPTATKIVVLGACFVCVDSTANDNITRWESADGGTSFGAPTVMGKALNTIGVQPNGTWLDAQGLFVTPAGGNTALVASPVAAVPVVGGGFVYTPSIVPVPGTTKLVHAANDLGAVQYAVHTGPALSADSIGNGANWTTNVGLTAPEGNSGETQLSSGPSGVSLTYRRVVPNDNRIVLRRFDAASNTFGGATEIQGSETIDGSADYPDSSQDASGRVHAVWLSRYSGNRLRHTRSGTDGAGFSAPADIAQGEVFIDPDVAAAPDGSGWAAWTGNGDTPVRVVRFEPNAGRSLDADPVTKTVAVKGGSIAFGVPRQCVPRGSTFRVTLSWKRQKRKGNLFVKVNRADFYIASKVVKIDRRAPFVQTLRVTASAKAGSKVTLRARAFIKVKRGKGPKKSIRATITVCS
jgi:hypothetical protein